MKLIFFCLLLITSTDLYSQELEYRSVDYYFDVFEKLQIEELKKVGVINDSLSINEKYRKVGEQGLNDEGFKKYFDIKTKVLLSYFKNYLYQQHLEYKDDIYVLYFSMAGFDDTEWQILKWNKKDWDKSDTIDLRLVEDVKRKKNYDEDISEYKFEPIVFNYDEGAKNLENVRIFIKNDFLVMERGNLYHSLYDLKNKKILVNEESPWNSSNAENKEDMNKWIKQNLHNKIDKTIN